MYCYRCGVRLPEGETVCPLCRTRMPEDGDKNGDLDLSPYSDRFPREAIHVNYLGLSLATAVAVAVCLICLLVCIKTYGAVSWSGYVMLGIAFLWVCAVLPFWFPKRSPLVFVPIDFAAAAGYLLYIDRFTGAPYWFLSFAFPVTGIACTVTVTAIALYGKLRRGRLIVTAGLLIGGGCLTMLVEFFEHVTFGTPMFLWSLYCVCFFSAIGVFLLIAGCVPPLRDVLKRKFFL